ncbi:hypothetical protein HME9304_00402 [Flagellimonas maritima]|uniref:Uncharacterized protein n=1 Tax=Flagellimonas maritima TaxID=1383885 RepID=A0A2Z4LPD8_9FLAO|nr:hypothetical protein HME9304_00402 [Allomuricauda aurantiaca]
MLINSNLFLIYYCFKHDTLYNFKRSGLCGKFAEHKQKSYYIVHHKIEQ